MSGASSEGDGTPLLLLSVTSPFFPLAKFSALLLRANLRVTDSDSANILHYGAAYERLEIMKRAVDLGISPLDADIDGNLPIHFASQADERIECLNFLIKKQSPVNAKNGDNESCLFLALQNRATKCVGRLLQAGATLTDSKLKYLQYDEVSLLADSHVIMMAPKPIEMALRFGMLFAKCSKRDESYRGELKALSENMQSLAVKLMIKAEWTESDITENLFVYGLKNEQKLVSYFI